MVPLSIYSAYKPVNKLPDRYHINELFKVPPSAHVLPKVAQIQGRLFSWSNMFRLLDRGLKLYERTGISFIRRRAIESAKKWMIDHFEKSDGVGAIFPPMIYTLVALKCLGYPEDSPEFKWAEEKLDELKLEDERGFRYQPCFSPIWDTAWSMLALRSAGLPADHPALVKAAQWTLAREIREPGDWKIFNGHLTPSGWAFEYNNKFYPDLDDTAIVLLALKQTSVFDEPACKETTERALKFLEGMRCSDGGWAAFDRDINNPVLEQFRSLITTRCLIQVVRTSRAGCLRCMVTLISRVPVIFWTRRSTISSRIRNRKVAGSVGGVSITSMALGRY